MLFLGDVTVPDGLYVIGGSSITKVWQIMNTGTCAWTPDYKLLNVSGAPMGANILMLEHTVNPGEIVDLNVTLKAPVGTGYYSSTWQMASPENVGFGSLIWSEIYVPQTNQKQIYLGGN